MRLAFDYVSVAGFRAILDPVTLLIDERLPGLYYLGGRNETNARLESNGAGKSSLLQALCWCLYGVTISKTADRGGLRSTDIQTWEHNETAEVVVGLRIDDVERVVVRNANPNRLLIDDEPSSQEQVLELLGGMTLDVFAHTVMYAQGSPLFLDLAPRQKMQLFVDVLGLDRWDERSAKASDEVAALERDVIRDDAALESIGHELATVEDMIAKAREREREWEQARLERRKGIEKQLAEVTKKVEFHRPKKDKADLAYDSAMTELRPLETEIERVRDDLRAVDRNVAQSEAQIEFNKRQLENLRAEARDLAQAKTCPTCGQPIKKSNVADHRKELDRHIADLTAKINTGIPPKTRQRRDELSRKLETLQASVAQFRDKADEARDNMIRAEAPLADAVAAERQLKAQLDRLTTESNPHRGSLKDARDRKAALEAERTAIKRDADARKREIALTKPWIKGFKDVRLLIVEEMLQELELAANGMLGEVGLDGWEIHFNVERENKSGTTTPGLHVSILSPANRSPVRWEVWSGGEEQRLRLVGADALSDVLLRHMGIECTTRFLDEPTRGLTTGGVRDLIDYLAGRAAERQGRIFLIDHLARQSARFAGSIMVIRDRAGVRLLEGA